MEQARAILKEKKLDAIVLFSKSPMFKYFIAEEFDKGLVILTKTRKMIFVSRLYSPGLPGFKVVQYSDFKKDFLRLVRSNGIKRAGFDGLNILLRQKKMLSKYFRAMDVGDRLACLRERKKEGELEKIRAACKITDEIFSLIIRNFKSFRKESEIATFIKIETLKRGAEMAFEPIVASGRNAVIAHHNMGSGINKGFMVLDFGARYKGYCSDMTRTVYVGRPTSREREIYNKVLEIQKSCISLARAGIRAESLFDHASDMFGKDARYFIHGLGHGFGIEIHEAPSLSRGSRDTLQNGTVLTIEPGYYNPKTGIGIRIEDDVYLGDEKEILTKSGKELIELR
jgi:Xaa-Pro aminopeptidase